MEEQKERFEVVCWCIAYNQKNYIRQTLDGFLMQKTNFPIVAVVHDDASTDGTAEIIKEYADKYPGLFIPLLEKENQWKKHDGSLVRISNEVVKKYGAKYLAFCEGDDYWTDPYKLQKQYDFLETHPDYSCCHTGFTCVDTLSKPIIREDYERKNSIGTNGERFWYTMLVENYILTCTIMVRSSIYITRPTWYHDYGIFLHAARQGYVGFIADKTSCYRQTPGSIMNDPIKLANLMIAHKRVTLNEIEIILNKEEGTLEKVNEFPNKNKAIGRMLIFCFQNSDKKLRNRVLRLCCQHPCIFINGLFQKIRGKAPKDFYMTSESIS